MYRQEDATAPTLCRLYRAQCRSRRLSHRPRGRGKRNRSPNIPSPIRRGEQAYSPTEISSTGTLALMKTIPQDFSADKSQRALLADTNSQMILAPTQLYSVILDKPCRPRSPRCGIVTFLKLYNDRYVHPNNIRRPTSREPQHVKRNA